MNRVLELFGRDVASPGTDWKRVVKEQQCPFLGKGCYKVRKSAAGTAIGTCTVLYGKPPAPVLICPARLLERRQIFTDCLHLLSTHTPGNELHIVREISVPGGSVDHFLVSARDGKVKDFVGIELQTLDTTGSVWPERQRLLKQLRIPRMDREEESATSYGMNWKMTAKTTLVQMHHKVHTFEHVHKKLVLVVQDRLLAYMKREFDFSQVREPAVQGDSVQLHAYGLEPQIPGGHRISLRSRVSTDAEGIARCLGLQAEARIDLDRILAALQAKLSAKTLFTPA